MEWNTRMDSFLPGTTESGELSPPSPSSGQSRDKTAGGGEGIAGPIAPQDRPHTKPGSPAGILGASAVVRCAQACPLLPYAHGGEQGLGLRQAGRQERSQRNQ